MSLDDIVFDEVKYREPVRARRPDRDRAWACLAYEVPRADDLPIFLDRRPADAIERHSLRDTSVELGGVLLGRECVDDQTGEPFVWVTEHLEAKHYENTQASFTYTHDAWEEVTRERDKLHPELDIVGWYHTHPDFGIFLSSHDLFLHRNFFGQPLQVAYVIDPIRQHRGFFRWRGDGLEQVGGFYLTADRADRVALARQVNDLESIAGAEPSTSGFSPRLEAELIAMLSRPHVSAGPAASAADRALLATVFTMLGLVLGGLAVAGGTWLITVVGQVREQTAILGAMQTKLDRSEQVSRAAVGSLLARAGSSTDPKTFVDELARSKADLADAQDQLKNQTALASAAAAEYRRVEAESRRNAEAEHEAAAKRDEYADKLDSQVAKTRAAALERDELLETNAGHLARRYAIAFYAAIGGWVVAAALATAWGVARLFAAIPPPAPRGDQA